MNHKGHSLMNTRQIHPPSPTKTPAFLFNVSAHIPFHLIDVARENFLSVDIINLNQIKSTTTLLGNHLSPAEESTFDKKSRAHLTCILVCLFNYCHLQYITVTASSLLLPFTIQLQRQEMCSGTVIRVYCMQNQQA